ncbi:hypothetical protein EVAR_51762_1 [Eumeta japonica]|uniref:Uncharacterized protein n=1 Tax=Eumeta variegata TaxID=151549 RepID=A0A4C1XFG2_EUMVA|nr:hypothetical protein EVAR_51762_1 [Eumeta japonica]
MASPVSSEHTHGRRGRDNTPGALRYPNTFVRGARIVCGNDAAIFHSGTGRAAREVVPPPAPRAPRRPAARRAAQRPIRLSVLSLPPFYATIYIVVFTPPPTRIRINSPLNTGKKFACLDSIINDILFSGFRGRGQKKNL